MTRSAPQDLTPSYRRCRELAARHGRTYFLATRLLPAERRPAVHALYGFARVVDDIVDTDTDTAEGGAVDRAAALDVVEQQLAAALAGRAVDDSYAGPVLPALADTIRRYDIPVEYFRAFLESMRMDVPGTPGYRATYPDLATLRHYMYGSAAVIGLQMLPVLGTSVPTGDAAPCAAALGEAFQLTNFLRDVGEDLDRGRVYLPADELAAFGVDADLLRYGRRTGTVDPRVRRALAHLVALTRSVYRRAEPGLDMLAPRARPGIRVAFVLYGDILDEIERYDFRILDRRATVPRRRRLAVALPLLGKSLLPGTR
ncbi:phytoene/squalene synthase family protein [Rhodococcus sp. SGAir0479]|uniref:phytoene/squalene synthase family protein n=1 Tax=Rhodococcus sp. SGAir0479 TaxID=2567884 RepID=UPI0010CD2A16|nr:phytoene/squalene synthase family protein [Rhodococcus sp. SGAir0479]QCQ91517.1 phytoene/squalene synthase family protein [Rhodococcus sp. SGAir0479]